MGISQDLLANTTWLGKPPKLGSTPAESLANKRGVTPQKLANFGCEDRQHFSAFPHSLDAFICFFSPGLQISLCNKATCKLDYTSQNRCVFSASVSVDKLMWPSLIIVTWEGDNMENDADKDRELGQTVDQKCITEKFSCVIFFQQFLMFFSCKKYKILIK